MQIAESGVVRLVGFQLVDVPRNPVLLGSCARRAFLNLTRAVRPLSSILGSVAVHVPPDQHVAALVELLIARLLMPLFLAHRILSLIESQLIRDAILAAK